MGKDAVGDDENGIEASQVPLADESTKHTSSLHARAHRDHHQQHQAGEPLDAVSIDDGSSIFATDTMDSRGEMCHHFRAGLHTWIDKFMVRARLARSLLAKSASRYSAFYCFCHTFILSTVRALSTAVGGPGGVVFYWNSRDCHLQSLDW